MAKESVDLPLIPEVTMSSRVELRRHSAGITSSGNDEKEIVVPRYLRASTGSCHDICKYGRNNVEEAKEKLSMIKRAGRKSLSRSSEDIIGGIMTSIAKQKASVDSKPTKMSTVKHSESELQISDTNNVEFPTKSYGSQNLRGNEILVNTSETSLLRVKLSFLPKSRISPIHEIRRGGISSSFEVETRSKPTSKRMVTSPTTTFERVKTHPISTSQMVNTSPESVSKMKQTSSKVSSFEGKKMELSNKRETFFNPDFITMKTISSRNSSDGLGGAKNSKIKMKKKEASAKSSRRGIGSVSARKHKGLKIVPHLMNQPKPIKVEFEEPDDEAQEKTSYAIKMESANQVSQSDQNESQDIEFPFSNKNESQNIELPLSNLLSSPKVSSPSKSQSSSQEDQEESEYTNSEFEEDACPGNQESEYSANVDSLKAEENGKLQKDGIVCSEDRERQKLGVNFIETKIEYMTNADTLEAEENGRPQKDGFLCSQDKECQKLGGNFVETQIEECNLRSLKFQQGNVLGGIAIDVKVVAITGPEKVGMRHEDVKVKREGQGLYNNVIEEKTSKLIETQKGKVKALIDAFESIISLEEKRTSAKIVN